jgi:hypothetical protein
VVKDLIANQLYALAFSGAIWSLVASTAWRAEFSFVVWLPAVFTLLSVSKWWALETGVRRIADYLQTIEARLAPKGFGWESSLRERRPAYFRPYHVTFWVVVWAGNLLLGSYVHASQSSARQTVQSSRSVNAEPVPGQSGK